MGKRELVSHPSVCEPPTRSQDPRHESSLQQAGGGPTPLGERAASIVHQAGRREKLMGRTFMTSSLSLGRKKSTIWYSLMGRECR